MSDPVCISCGNAASLLCDYVIGNELLGTIPTPYIGLESALYTCDAPLCGSCAKHVGSIFFDGAPEVTGVESVDHCPVHADESAPPLVNPITAADADVLRREAWARIRRRSIRALRETV